MYVTRRFLFLDIDGVINPFDEHDPTRLGTDWTRPVIGGYSVWVSPSLGNWLNHLIADGIDIVWATTWIRHPDHLAEYATALGLPTDLARIGYLRADGANCGKRPAIEDFLAAIDEPWTAAWVDDDHGLGDHKWATTAGVATFTPDPRFGLSGQRIRREIAEHLMAPTTV